MSRLRKILTLVSLTCAVAGLAVWNYAEPLTSSYEINPITLSVRSIEYFDRPITGRSMPRNVLENEMAIGIWLRENGFLNSSEKEGYWVTIKSYNTKRGFQKGAGIYLRRAFDQSNMLSPMPTVSHDGKNLHWIDWCNANPENARWTWAKYISLAEKPNQLVYAADILTAAIQYSPDGSVSFENAMENRMTDYQLTD